MKSKGDIARVNKGETEIFPCDEYRVFVLGMDDVVLPCLYIETLKEDCLIKADFDGHCEKRDINNPDLYKETEAKLIEWFPRQSKDVHAEGKTNLEWIRHVWGIIHD